MFVAVDLFGDMAGHWPRFISAHRAVFHGDGVSPYILMKCGVLELTSFVFS